MTPIEKVTSAVSGKVTKQGGWFRCPHPCSPKGDTPGSFAFRETPDGTVIIKSHKPSYTVKDCVAALGLELKDLFPENDIRDLGEFRGSKIVRGYEFTTENGAPAGRVCRTEDKQFPQGEYVGSELRYKLTKPLPLYLITYVLQWVKDGETIYVTEGEKDALALIKAGYAATSKPGGAGSKWAECHVRALKGADVVIVADRDIPGYKGATEAFAALSGVAKSVRIVEAKTGKDSYDHLQHHTVDEFVPRPDLIPLPRLVGMNIVQAERPRFLWDDWKYLRVEQVNLLDAKGASGKTSLAIFLACCGSNGASPMGTVCEPFNTLYYGNEDSVGEIRGVVDDMSGDPSRIHVVEHPFQITDQTLQIVEQDLYESSAKLFVIDAAKYYLSERPNAEFDGALVARFFANVRELARKFGCAPLFVRHFAKNQSEVDLAERGAGLEQWRNSSRSQLVMIPCPHKKGNSMVWHTKASLRSEAQEPFGCGWRGGVYGVWTPNQKDFESIGINPDGTVMKRQRKQKQDDPAPYWAD